MTFDEYDAQAAETAVYPNVGRNHVYPTLGLAGEAGEVAGKVSKIERDLKGVLNDEVRAAIKMELGDVLWFLSRTAIEFGTTLDEVANANIEKLRSRKERKQLHGNGDYR